MKKSTLHILRCPNCQSQTLIYQNTRNEREGGIDGELNCTTCNKSFLVERGIARFLSPEDIEEYHRLSESDNLNHKVKSANVIYHDHVSKDYENDISSSCVFDKYSQSRIKEVLRKFVSQCGKRSLLIDLGCGTGNILKTASNLFTDTIGIDISPEMVAMSADRGFEVLLGDIEDVPLISESADVVTAFSVLHHLHDPHGLFKEAFRLLKNGGFFYSDFDPNRSSKIIQKNLLFILAKKAYNLYGRLIAGKKISEENKDIRVVQNLAEYYHNYESGFDTNTIQTSLKRIGFSDISIYHHGNCYSLEKNSFWHIPFVCKVEIITKACLSLTFDYYTLSPHFLIIAQK